MKPPFTSTFLFSRTDATSNVIVAMYGASVGKADAGVVAAPACPEVGTARNVTRDDQKVETKSQSLKKMVTDYLNAPAWLRPPEYSVTPDRDQVMLSGVLATAMLAAVVSVAFTCSLPVVAYGSDVHQTGSLG